MTQAILIGRLLRAGTTGFVVGCRVTQLDSPSFGALVKAPVSEGYEIFGMIYDIHVDDDGLVRQLVTAESVDESVINDNRLNRNVPLEMSVLSVGYRQDGQVYHLLPPRPPLSLDVILLCGQAELRQFTAAGRFGYFRHVLRAQDLPVGEVLAAHVQQAQRAHVLAGDPAWGERATQELITLLRDDYPTLMQVLGALGDAVVSDEFSSDVFTGEGSARHSIANL
jgi:hypothetical protein